MRRRKDVEMLQFFNANDRAYVRVTMSQLRFIQLRVDAQTLWTGACVDPRVGAAVRRCDQV